MDTLGKKQAKLPDAPGVYFFIGKRKEVLYIGRATSLARRVPSYFARDLREKRSPLIEKMVAEAKAVEWLTTDSVLEAVLLEVRLIRTHKPPYNTISKDDKSYNHVVITDEEFPRVLVLRAKDLRDARADVRYRKVYGPFTSGKLLRDALKIIQRIFRFYDVRTPLSGKVGKVTRGVLNFNRQIGLYPDAVGEAAYARTIRHLELFFEGKKEKVIAELTKEMMRAAKREEFEEANRLKQKVLALKHIQDIALVRDDLRTHRDDRRIRIEAYDVAHLSGTNMVGVMTVVENGTPDSSAYRTFTVRSLSGANDPAALREVIERRMAHPEWPYPDLIVVDGNSVQKRVAERAVKSAELFIPVVAVVKDERHRPREILGTSKLIGEHETAILLSNAEAHRFAVAFHRKKRNTLPR